MDDHESFQLVAAAGLEKFDDTLMLHAHVPSLSGFQALCDLLEINSLFKSTAYFCSCDMFI